jgi:hypothetical protein
MNRVTRTTVICLMALIVRASVFAELRRVELKVLGMD